MYVKKHSRQVMPQNAAFRPSLCVQNFECSQLAAWQLQAWATHSTWQIMAGVSGSNLPTQFIITAKGYARHSESSIHSTTLLDPFTVNESRLKELHAEYERAVRYPFALIYGY